MLQTKVAHLCFCLVRIDVCSVDLLVSCLRISTGFKGDSFRDFSAEHLAKKRNRAWGTKLCLFLTGPCYGSMQTQLACTESQTGPHSGTLLNFLPTGCHSDSLVEFERRYPLFRNY